MTLKLNPSGEALHLLSDTIPTPLGELIIVADIADHLRAIAWVEHELRMKQLLSLQYGKNSFVLSRDGVPSKLTSALRDYFAGNLDVINHLPIATGGTAFQRAVWQELRCIPCGEMISYKALAERLRRNAAVRAVGLANGANPIGIVIPCHRVVGSNGSLTGYGSGLHRKRWLLAHECRENPGSELFSSIRRPPI